MGPRVELKQEPVSPLIVIKNPWVILLTSGLLFDITTAPYSGGDICGNTPALRSKTSRVAKRDDTHSKLLFFVKNKGQWKAKSGSKVADGNVAMRTKISRRLESK